MIAGGAKLVRVELATDKPDGRGFLVASDGIALSTDGKTLYWQPLTGRTLYRIGIDLLMSDDAAAVGKKVEKAGASCVTDGLLMSRDGHLYLTSPEDNSVKLWEGATAPAPSYRIPACAGPIRWPRRRTARSTSPPRTSRTVPGSTRTRQPRCPPGCSGW